MIRTSVAMLLIFAAGCCCSSHQPAVPESPAPPVEDDLPSLTPVAQGLVGIWRHNAEATRNYIDNQYLTRDDVDQEVRTWGTTLNHAVEFRRDGYYVSHTTTNAGGEPWMRWEVASEEPLIVRLILGAGEDDTMLLIPAGQDRFATRWNSIWHIYQREQPDGN